jgi:hypothetical protein
VPLFPEGDAAAVALALPMGRFLSPQPWLRRRHRLPSLNGLRGRQDAGGDAAQQADRGLAKEMEEARRLHQSRPRRHRRRRRDRRREAG